ncbi:MAG: arylamine N-acetyltransferase [Burkholderiales bacterium]|nr:arylamine N-acetyltransferase [Burkholderiales bacterium]
MHAHNFELSSYLRRIGFEGPARPDIETVAQMMRRQLMTVPFENLDVQAGKVVSLVPEDIVDKIVNHPRGGYCYEVNGLFAMALQALGVPYQFVACRPMFYPVRRPKTHMALVLTLDGVQWLVDLGFGSYGIRQPMRLDRSGQAVQQDHDQFKLTQSSDNHLLQAFSEGQWLNQYEFNLSPQEWIDFAPANYLNSTHPDAIFVQKHLIIVHTPTGRKMLIGETLKTVDAGKVQQQTVPIDQRASVLDQAFGLRQ